MTTINFAAPAILMFSLQAGNDTTALKKKRHHAGSDPLTGSTGRLSMIKVHYRHQGQE